MSLWGCSKGNDAVPAGAAIDPITNKHLAGMAVAVAGGAHVGAYYENPSYCIQCHGETSDLSGGITKVSCSTVSRSGISCHAGKWPHGFGYAAFNLHGNTARSAAAGFIGMAYCKNCHGSDYKGVSGVGVSCVDCHSGADGSHAPHAANWKTGANLNGLKHSRTHASNAAACAQCHLGGTFSHAPPKPAPAGTSPGCFNGTLCHNQAGHNPYTVATHQSDARADVTCGIYCHATPATATSNPSFTVPFSTTSPPSDITSMTAGCQSAGCHNQKPGLAHPYIWLPNRVSGITTTHGDNGTTGIPGNILGACGTCHNVTAVGAKFGVPSCMSGAAGVTVAGITCHFTAPVTGTNVTAGCNSCHGGLPSGPNGSGFPNFSGAHPKHTAISGVTCNTCHNGLGSGTAQHANGTADILFLASQAGVSATYDAATQTCSNVTCHALVTTPAWTAKNQGCTACHPTPPDTNNHMSHWNAFPIPAIKCDACHTGDGPGVTAVHPDAVVVKGFPARFNDGGASYTAGACSKISCHGSKTTPQWTGAAIPEYVYDPSGANCTANCHTVRNPPTQYIDVFNGDNNGYGTDLHDAHLNYLNYVCTDCHGLQADKLPKWHFSGLYNGKRLLVPGYAAGTLGGTGTKINSYTYDAVTPGRCDSTCHVPRNWFK